MCETGTKRSALRTCSLISSRSARFSRGSTTVRTPAFMAAIVFSRRPPMGRTRPRSVISPVMATLLFTGTRVSAEIIAVAVVMPAEGPSFGIAPSGKWICRSFVL